MIIPFRRFSNPSAIISLGISLFAVSARQLPAVNDPSNLDDCPEMIPCPTCADPNATVLKSVGCPSSFNMSINVGVARVDRVGDFLTYSRVGLNQGQAGKGFYSDFDTIKNSKLRPANDFDKEMKSINLIQGRVNSTCCLIEEDTQKMLIQFRIAPVAS
jgi:hypothetical protein